MGGAWAAEGEQNTQHWACVAPEGGRGARWSWSTAGRVGGPWAQLPGRDPGVPAAGWGILGVQLPGGGSLGCRCRVGVSLGCSCWVGGFLGFGCRVEDPWGAAAWWGGSLQPSAHSGRQWSHHCRLGFTGGPVLEGGPCPAPRGVLHAFPTRAGLQIPGLSALRRLPRCESCGLGALPAAQLLAGMLPLPGSVSCRQWLEGQVCLRPPSRTWRRVLHRGAESWLRVCLEPGPVLAAGARCCAGGHS